MRVCVSGSVKTEWIRKVSFGFSVVGKCCVEGKSVGSWRRGLCRPVRGKACDACHRGSSVFETNGERDSSVMISLAKSLLISASCLGRVTMAHGIGRSNWIHEAREKLNSKSRKKHQPTPTQMSSSLSLGLDRRGSLKESLVVIPSMYAAGPIL